MAKQINPQGYNYGKDPTNSNPFWSESEIAEKLTASASVDNTTGTPEVSVSTTGYNVDFKFSGLKGERGEKGEQGIQGVQGEPGVQGNPGASGKDGKNGYNVTMDATGSKQSGTISTILYGYTMENGEYKSQTSYVYNGERGERGERGEQGEPGVAGKDGKDGKDADISSCVTDVSVANENGKYTIKQTKGTGTGAVESEVGEVTVPDTSNLLAEITDSITENVADGYNHHVIKETENNGTKNDVGNFYIARKQITSLNSDGTFTTVDQTGAKESGAISLGGGGIDAFKSLDIQPIPITSFTPTPNNLYVAKIGVAMSFNNSTITANFVYSVLFWRQALSNIVITGSQNDLLYFDNTVKLCFCRFMSYGIGDTEIYGNLFLYYDSSKIQSIKVKSISASVEKIGGLTE